ncbi:MAG: hypothetical protein LC641_05305, partial [Spirochaeta sp.]|nr:hypothetical protein [Spirochaeta sp.]
WARLARVTGGARRGGGAVLKSILPGNDRCGARFFPGDAREQERYPATARAYPAQPAAAREVSDCVSMGWSRLTFGRRSTIWNGADSAMRETGCAATRTAAMVRALAGIPSGERQVRFGRTAHIHRSDQLTYGHMLDRDALNAVESEFRQIFSSLQVLQASIREKLTAYSDGKNLKGNELVGWLGEIYGKLLLGGRLVDDREEHDFVTPEGWRVSVKTRKGWQGGWKQSSSIPKIEGPECPTHLLFVHLNDDYSVDRMWLFAWGHLFSTGRFRTHVVRGAPRSFILSIDERRDAEYLLYKKD